MELETGKTYGYWTIVSLSGKDKKHILCRCVCGVEKELFRDTIKFNKSQSCGCKSKQVARKRREEKGLQPDLTGRRFGRYTAIRLVEEGDAKYERWLCRCDCGTERVLARGNMVQGRTKSCGCGGRQHDPKLAAIKEVMNQYRFRSKESGWNFSLSIEEFGALVLGACRYCGKTGGCHYRDPSRHHSEEWRQKKQIEYTGIDRINSDLGYTIENTCSCCLTCNKAKNTMTENQFREWILSVYNWARNTAPADAKP